MAPEAAPMAAPASGMRKIKPINEPQKVPEIAPTAFVLQLVQFDAAFIVLHGDHRVAHFDQVLLLHRKEFLPDLLGLGFGRESNNNEVAHVMSPVFAIAHYTALIESRDAVRS